jgi:hypothetical protein
MSDSDGEHSLRGSDDEESEGTVEADVTDSEDSHSDEDGVIYLSSDEDDELPLLLGGSSSRRKTIETYVAPAHLRDTIYRCREYPRGVYINRYGEVCPNDARSGRYQKRPRDEDEEDVVDEEDVFHEVSRRSNALEDEDDEWIAGSESSGSEATSSEASHSEVEEHEDVDDEPAAKRSKLEPNDLGEPLTDEQKRTMFMQELHSALERTHAMEAHSQRSRKTVTTAQKLNDQLGLYVEEWDTFAKREAKGIQFAYDSKFVVDEPSCDLRFVSKSANARGEKVQKVLYCASMNCNNMMLECPCHTMFTSVKSLYLHLKAAH